MALLTSSSVSSLPDDAPIPWLIICSCKKGPSCCWYWAKWYYWIPIFIIICCWSDIPISWIWVIPWAIILRYWSRFWSLFCLLYFFLSFLKFLENLKISFLEASSEKLRMVLISSREGFWRLICDLIFLISLSRLNSGSCSSITSDST